MTKSILRVSVLLMILLIAAPGASAQAWPDVFNPFRFSLSICSSLSRIGTRFVMT